MSEMFWRGRMKEFVFKDTGKTTYSIQAQDIHDAEKMFDLLWLHQHKSIMKKAEELGITLKMQQNIWIEY